MAQYTRRDDVLARSVPVPIGIDVHKWSWHVTALVESEKVFSGAMPAEYAALKNLPGAFRRLRTPRGVRSRPLRLQPV